MPTSVSRGNSRAGNLRQTLESDIRTYSIPRSLKSSSILRQLGESSVCNRGFCMLTPPSRLILSRGYFSVKKLALLLILGFCLCLTFCFWGFFFFGFFTLFLLFFAFGFFLFTLFGGCFYFFWSLFLFDWFFFHFC